MVESSFSRRRNLYPTIAMSLQKEEDYLKPLRIKPLTL
jgi:hypothetical protein